MYEYIGGEVRFRSAARIVIEASGVGYEIVTPPGLAFPRSGQAKVWTHLAVREDAHTLYGFPNRETRELFRLLLRVRGVGPAMALGVIAGMSREELVEAIRSDDLKRLTRIKGVGKKTAEQILLDLRDKLSAFAEERLDDVTLTPAGRTASTSTAPTQRQRISDATAALISVGYSEKDAQRQVERAAKEVGTDDLEELVRAALST